MEQRSKNSQKSVTATKEMQTTKKVSQASVSRKRSENSLKPISLHLIDNLTKEEMVNLLQAPGNS